MLRTTVSGDPGADREAFDRDLDTALLRLARLNLTDHTDPARALLEEALQETGAAFARFHGRDPETPEFTSQPLYEVTATDPNPAQLPIPPVKLDEFESARTRLRVESSTPTDGGPGTAAGVETIHVADTGVWWDGRLAGVLSLGRTASWTPAETCYLGALADRFALFLESNRRRRAEDALLDRERKLDEIEALTTLGSWEWNLETGRIIWSAAQCRIHGLPVEERERTFEQFLMWVHPEDRQRVLDECDRLVATGEPFSFPYRIVRSDGTIREMHALGKLLPDPSGGGLRAVGTSQDVTDRNRAERALQRAYEELERRVAERTAELAEANSALASEVQEHERAREQLTRRTEDLEGVFAALPDVYLRLDPNGTILDHRAGRGATPLADTSDLIGRTLSDLLPADVTASFAEAIEQVRQTHDLAYLEYQIHSGDTDRHFEARLLPSGDSSLITIVRDITDRKKNEEAVRRSEEHFRTLIENGTDFVMIIDAAGAITYVAPSSEHLLGYTQEEMLDKMPPDLVHPDDLPGVFAILSELVATPGRVFHSEYRIRHKNGSWRVFESFGRTLQSDSAAAGVLVNSRDITKSKSAQTELMRQKAYFEEILDSIDAGIAVFDRDGRYEYVNAQSVQDPERRAWAIGKTVREYGERRGLREEVIRQREESIAAAVRNRVRNHFEEEVHLGDGSVRHMYRRLIPLFDEAGEIVRLLGYSIDITERKQAELALQQAKDEAERANRAKSEFLSRMSHELRTPLNGILGFAQVLERDQLSTAQRKYVGHILNGGRHLLRLINEVLELSRIEAGRISLSLEPIQLSGVVREALDLVRPVAEEAHIQLSLDASDFANSYVRADRQRLVQILLNLLSNAIKYNRPGGSVRITCSETTRAAERYLSMTGAAGGRYLSATRPAAEWYHSIRVVDTGRGIPEDRLDQLFVPFARLGAEQTETEGTGLGLALSKRLAEAMGGVLMLERTGREGSVFRLDLRRAGNPLDEMRLPEGTESEGGEAVARPATILYIEDNLTNLSLVETFLESKPAWRTISALRGETGIELARQEKPDLILLDLHLPDLHGEEVLRALRADSSTAHIPVVVISADATPSAIQRLRSVGSDAYLTKPLDLDEFLSTVERFLLR